MSAGRVTKRRDLAGLAGPVGIACLGVAILLAGLGSASGLSTRTVGLTLSAAPLAAVGLWLLAVDWAWKDRPVDEPKPGRIVYEETKQ